MTRRSASQGRVRSTQGPGRATTGDILQSIHPEDLVRRCRAHSPGAWEEFLRRYADLIHSTIVRMGLDDSDRQDAFQAAVLSIYDSIDRLRNPDSLLSWIVGISRRRAMDQLRRRARRREVPVEERSGTGESDLVDTSVLPDSARIELEGAQQVREAMAALPERCRRLLSMLFFEEPSPEYAEISRRESIPIGSIGPTRARCLERVRRFFQDKGWLG